MYRAPATNAAAVRNDAPMSTGIGRLGERSPSPITATGGSDAAANAPSGPPESRSAARPPMNAHHTASPAPAASDHEPATRNGRFGRAPPIEMNGTTALWRSAAASGTAIV